MSGGQCIGARNPDVGGECAVYMMAKSPERLCEQAFLPGLSVFSGRKTLTPRRSAPIRPRFLKWT
jgi:hypothetical protein